MNIKNYIQENEPRFLDELFSLLRIPSISSQSEHKEDMVRCAERWKELIMAAGADSCDIYPTEGNPIVVGKKMVDPNAKTVLVYGHYDVMPVDPIELWNTEPFEPVIKDGKIWARGADDDKGQSFMQAKAFEYMVRTGNLPCNVKFMLEGEEEIGSGSLYGFCEKNKELLKADIILVCDTSMIGPDTPSITSGLRGLCYWEVEVTGANHDLHSGIFGGAVANPINVLCKMIADLHDEDGHITIPGFYDDVLVLSDEERALMAQAPFDEEQYKRDLGVRALKGEKGYTTLERTGIRPCLDVCGIWGGYTGEGAKTVLPSEAHAKISMRLVPNQLSSEITRLFAKHFKSIAPKYVKVEVTPCEGGDGFLIPISSSAYKAASRAIAEVYGIEPVPARGGGSIAVLAEVQKILGIDPLLLGFGLERDTIHSPNESYLLSQLFRGMESIARFYDYW